MFETILEILKEATIDSLKMLPVIFVCYVVIELLEDKILNKYQTNKLLKSPFAPVVSAGFGLIPQCGFSLVATDLFSKKAITLGSLFAIYLATSDEALPLLLTNSNNYLSLLYILLIKFGYAVLVGLTIDLIFKNKKQALVMSNNFLAKNQKNEQQISEDKSQETDLKASNNEEILAVRESKNEEVLPTEHIQGCCHHDIENDHKGLKEIFLHPLLHSLKIFAFILLISIIFGAIVEFVGENAIKDFMTSTGFFEPFIVSIVGLIPNCASSVIITELFMAGSISLGSTLAGLSVNSGLALVLLFKTNKNTKQNVLILISLYSLSVLLGVIVNLF